MAVNSEEAKLEIKKLRDATIETISILQTVGLENPKLFQDLSLLISKLEETKREAEKCLSELPEESQDKF